MDLPKDMKPILKFISETLYGAEDHKQKDAENIFHRYIATGYSYDDILKGSPKALGTLKSVAYDYLTNEKSGGYEKERIAVLGCKIQIGALKARLKAAGYTEPLMFRTDVDYEKSDDREDREDRED